LERGRRTLSVASQCVRSCRAAAKTEHKGYVNGGAENRAGLKARPYDGNVNGGPYVHFG